LLPPANASRNAAFPLKKREPSEPGCYDDAYGLWLDAQGPDVRDKARVAMPADRTRFDYYTFAGNEKTTQAWWVTSETIRFIKANANRPFFVHAGFYAPHPPLNPPASELARYDDVELPPRHPRDGEMDGMPKFYRRAAGRQAETTEAVWTAYRKHFYAMVSMLDTNVGRIMKAVEQAGIADRTLIVVTSDHGDYLGAHNLVSKSILVYEEVMNIPLIIRGPGIPKGAKPDALAEIIDLMPTLLDLAGAKAPEGVQGISLRKAMTGGKARDLVFMEGYGVRMIRTPQAKYAIHRGGTEVLFDLTKDAHEFNNLAADKAAKPLLDRMRKRLLTKLMSAADPLPLRIAPY